MSDIGLEKAVPASYALDVNGVGQLYLNTEAINDDPLPEKIRRILSVIATSQGSIDYCNSCMGRRNSNNSRRSALCAREALPPSINGNPNVATFALLACVNCADITRQGGKTPIHGIRF